MHWPIFIIFIGAILVAIGGLFLHIRQNKLTNKLNYLSEKNVELSQKIEGLVYGGNSFCYLDYSGYDPSTNSLYLSPIHEGKYPLYDVDITIIDIEKWNQILKDLSVNKSGPITWQQINALEQAKIHKKIGNLTSMKIDNQTYSQSTPIILHPHNENKQSYNINISARNGVFIQLLRLIRVNGQWISALKVNKYGEKKSLLERIDSRFPLDNSNQVKW